MRWRHPLMVSLLVLAACEAPSMAPELSSSPATATTNSALPEAPSAAPKLCEQAAKLAARVASLDTQASRINVGGDISLPESKDGAAVPLVAPVVVIAPKAIRVGGQSVRNPADVARLVEGQRQILLAIPRGEEGINRVAGVVSAIGDEVEIMLLAAIPGAKLEPVPRGMDLGKSDQSERARRLAEALSKSIDGCPAAKKLFQGLAADEPSGRAERLKRELPAAFDACSCKVGDDAVDLVSYLLAGDPPVVGKRLTLSTEPSAKAISLKGLDGQKLYDALPSDGAAVRFEK